VKKRGKIKKIMIYLFSFLLLAGISITLFLNLNPSFGGNLTKEQKESYKNFSNFVNGKFVNEVSTRLFKISTNSSKDDNDYNTGDKERTPSGKIPVSKIDWDKIRSEKDSITPCALSLSSSPVLVSAQASLRGVPAGLERRAP
jgi:hypothetical protein